MKDKNLDKKLLQKFKVGKCTPEEVRKVLRWYQSEEAETSFSIEFENYWNEENERPFLDKEKVYDQIRKRIEYKGIERGRSRNPIPGHSASRIKHGFRYRSKIIVVIILLLISVPLLYFNSGMFRAPPKETKVNWMFKETSFGQRNTVKLPDGTLVKLNSGSRIHYPEVFQDSLRLIDFEGEAYFEVAEDVTKPFVIRSGNINTMVLGTSFNLKSATVAESFELAVLTGSVKVVHNEKGQNEEERYVNPNQSAIWDDQSRTFRVEAFDPTMVFSWVEGILVFNNSSFEDIVFTLEKWYGINIDTSTLRRNLPTGYTGKYKDKSLETVLQGLSYVLDFKYEINGKEVIIK